MNVADATSIRPPAAVFVTARVSLDEARVPAHRVHGLPCAVRTALLDATDLGTHAVALFDPDDRLSYSNAAFQQAWAVDPAQVVTFASMIRHCFATKQGPIVATTDVEAWIEAAQRNRRTSGLDRAFEVDLWDGRWMWLTERRLDSGWILVIAQDITPLKNSERTLRLARDAAVKASLTDSLTLLPNRRSAMQHMEACTARKQVFHIALMDIDNFKRINDLYGHAAGDEALILFAGELEQLQQLDCFVARLAGDEFLVVGRPDESPSEFRVKLRGMLDRRMDRCANGTPAEVFAVSAGAARFPADGVEIQQLLSAADTAMYRAKAQGNCTLDFARGAPGHRLS